MAGRLAYVTGGMGGIGTPICRRLCREGFRVVAGCGPGSQRKDKWIADMRAQGFEVHASEGNVGGLGVHARGLREESATSSGRSTCSSTTRASRPTAPSAR